MNPLASLGSFLVHLLVTLVACALLAGGAVFVVRWAMGRDHTAVTQGVTIAADKDARASDAQHDSDTDQQAPAAVARGARAQRAVDDVDEAAAQNETTNVDADRLRAIWGEPAHAPQ